MISAGLTHPIMKGDGNMFKKQITLNVEKLDEQIDVLLVALEQAIDSDHIEILNGRLETLVKLRCELAESKSGNSRVPMMISGLVHVGSILMVLHYEKTDVITSKVYSMATKMFKEGV